MAKAASHLEGVMTMLVNQSNYVLPYHRVPEGHTLACIDTSALSHLHTVSSALLPKTSP